MSENGVSRFVIAGGARTPVGVKCGTLSRFAPEDLAVEAANEAVRRAGVDVGSIDAAFGANVYQFTAPGGQDIYFPRNVALRCGLPTEVPSLLVQRICGSGFQTVVSALQQIAMPAAMDDTRVALCFGAETMSRAPRILRAPRLSGAHFWEFGENGGVEDTILAGLNHDLAHTTMMLTADEYGAERGVTRAECDAFAEESHARARRANRESHLNGGTALEGLFPFEADDLDGQPVCLAHDECVRDTTADELSRLPGITPHGLVTAGNASEISDGAAALVVADRERAEELGLPTRFEIAAYGISGVEPRVMGRGPVPAIRQALDRTGLDIGDIGLWEINEAFAAQAMGAVRELGLDDEKVNVNGGAVAIGHPLAATGARLMVDLMYEMDRRGEGYGCASACIGGGQGLAVIIRDSQRS
ncbi:MAG: thiolase family protein [Planctomycetes bacterium]|nr:thiolase family protein [Planctomycetota bacterium]